jgi:nucleotide sugar dehydrogenase
MIGIIGIGCVGSALVDSFIKNKIEIIKYDILGPDTLLQLLNCDIIFMTLPTNYNEKNKSYCYKAIHDNCIFLNKKMYKGTIVLKSTVEPGTTDKLEKLYTNLDFVYNPEFLTEKTAFNDFHNQPHIIIGKTLTCNKVKYANIINFYKKYYKNSNISECSSIEAESVKMFANAFYATKIGFFTEIYLLCQQLNINFDIIKNLMLKNGWINKMHTDVPGPDGEISFGGKCFPKDIKVLLNFMKDNTDDYKLIEAVVNENNILRK